MKIEHLLNHSRGAALLILDYSYIGLSADDHALVGGILYFGEGKEVEFYAPLKKWSGSLNAILNN